jgi:hypothetical protein
LHTSRRRSGSERASSEAPHFQQERPWDMKRGQFYLFGKGDGSIYSAATAQGHYPQ